MLLQVGVDKDGDLLSRVLCKLRTPMPVKNADRVGVEGLQLLANYAVFAGSIRLVLHALHSAINAVFLQ